MADNITPTSSHSASGGGGGGTPSIAPTNYTSNRSSIFHRGPAFALETFTSKEFIVKEFIESLSDFAIPTSQRRSGGTAGTAQQPFDPKPLIRTFEHAKRRLYEVSGDLELRENELSAAVRRAEAQHAQSVASLGKKLNQAIESFQKLDASFETPNSLSSSALDGPVSGGGVTGNMAVETGKKLEELQRQRRRALDAHFLIECWDEVSNRGELTLLENLRRSSSGAAKVRCAHIAKQLLRISHRLDSDNWDPAGKKDSPYKRSPSAHGRGAGQPGAQPGPGERNTREIIEKFSETLEKDLLKQFDDFYRKANFDGMRDCAAVLYDFNAGASVIGLFLNQHQFFIDRAQLINEEVGGDSDFWEKLADPDADNPTVEPSLQSLVDEVKVVAQEESSIIKRAFPYHEQVLGKFLQRVFQQSIQQRLEMVLDKASNVSSLAFLRSLQTSRSYISTLVDDMKSHGLTEHPEHISSQTAVVLDQQLEDLFVPYFLGSSYIEKEKKNLEEL
ncbi:Exocyst complex component 5, partial [Ascosphaera atra]